MEVTSIQARELDGSLERSALVRHGGGEVRLRTTVPNELAGEPDDASPFVPLALLAAMHCHEDLVVDGPVSPLLLDGLRRAAELYRAWSPALRASAIEVAEERPCRPSGATDVACFFSRGVDSTYSAAVPRERAAPVSRLVFMTGFEPEHDDEVRAEEIRRAAQAAERIGLPMHVASTNLFDLAATTVADGDDHTAAGLALTGLACGGGARTLIVPSSDRTATIGPQGTSPVLDPLLSTEAVALEHDSTALGRVQKTLWIAQERPELLAQLKVCISENRPDNCGVCSKCLLTMGTLKAVGKLGLAEQFPDDIDVDPVRTKPHYDFQSRIEWAELARTLDAGQDPELRRAILDSLEIPLAAYPGPPPRLETPAFRLRHATLLMSTMRDARPWPPPPGSFAAPPGLGLVRVVDRARGRHVYGVGTVPSGELAAELGSLPRVPASDLEPVWVLADGRLTTEPARGPDRGLTAGSAIRWVLAPLRWRDIGEPAGARARAAAARVRDLIRSRHGRGGEPAERIAVVAYVHRHDLPGRLPLYSSTHAVTGDQLLTTSRREATDMGYAEPVRLGYLDGQAQLTGSLEPARPRVPWASRFGQAVRR